MASVNTRAYYLDRLWRDGRTDLLDLIERKPNVASPDQRNRKVVGLP
jgi:hypothetical protein